VPTKTHPEALAMSHAEVERALRDGRPSLEQQWQRLQPMLDAAVDRVNALLAPQQLALGAAGAPDWSYKHRGYGAHRRLLCGSDSIAWLRLELTADARLTANLKAHREDRAGINAAAERTIEGFNPAHAADLLFDCLRAAAGPIALQGGRAPVVSERVNADAVVGSALKATNGALGQAGARIIPLLPEPGELGDPSRMALRVEVDGKDVAGMHIERLHHELEVAVDLRDARLADLGRRHRLPLEGMTIHALAELIAGCAWPAIAHFRDVPQRHSTLS
jgi:hypothetical protein